MNNNELDLDFPELSDNNSYSLRTDRKKNSRLSSTKQALLKEGVDLEVDYYEAEPDIGIIRGGYDVSARNIVSDFSKKRIDDPHEAYVVEDELIENAYVGTLEEWFNYLKVRSFEFGEPEYNEILQKNLKWFFGDQITLKDALSKLSKNKENATIVEYKHAITGEPIYLLSKLFEDEPEDLGLVSVYYYLENLSDDYFD